MATADTASALHGDPLAMTAAVAASAPASPVVRAVGPMATLTIAVVVEVLSGTPLHVVNPPALFVLAIVCTAFTGGLGPGLISAAIAWGYTAHFFSEPTGPFVYTGDNLRRVVVWGAVMPLIALIVGVLNRRARQATAEARVAVLREMSERRFRTLLDHANDAIEIIDPATGRFLDVNAKACQAHGYTRDEYLALSVPDIDPLMTVDALERSMAEARRSGSEVLESQHRRKDGSLFPVEINKTYIRLDRDYLVAVVRDATERRRATALVEGQSHILEMIAVGSPLDDILAELTRLIESQADGMLCSVLLLDHDGVHVRHGAAPSLPEAYVSAIDGASIGPKAGSCGTAMYLRKPVIVTDILRDPLWEDHRHLAAPHGLRACWSTPIVSHDGRVLGSFAMYYRDVRSPGPAETRLVEIATNLAGIAIERKRVEEALRESRELYRTLARNYPDGFVLLFDTDLRFRIADGAGLEQLRLSREGIEGKTLLQVTSPEAARTLEPIYRAALDGRESRLEYPDADRVYLLTVVPVKDAEGVINGGLAVYLDITDMKRLEEQYRHAQKMEAVGQLAGGVAHDFNNLLTVINGCSELVFNSLAAGDANRELLAETRKAGERAAHLTQQLLAFSRKQVLQPEVVCLNALLRDLLKLLQRLIGEDIELTLSPDPALARAKVDPGQFEQAIVNLVVNARDAMPDGGRLTIETRNAELDAAVAARYPEVTAGRYALVAVSDSGQGMDEATQARIFEPFFTTKGPGKGTGLGLAMVYGFVKQSGGHIDVHSEPGRGTTFTLYLPRAEHTVAGDSAPPVREAPKGTETVLLVEDEDAVRALVKRVLASNGYVVLEAPDGAEAIALAQAHPGRIHLLLTDLVMPRMSGRQLASRLVQQRPGMRILFMSGYSDEGLVSHAMLRGGIAFLQKPFSPVGLARKVREVLDASDGERTTGPPE